VHPEDTTVDHLLSPLSVEQFETEYWEQRPLHIQRPYPPFYQSLLRGQDLPSLAAALKQRGQESQAFFDRKSCKSRGLVRDFFDGGSVVLNRIDKLWAPIGQLCVSLRKQLHHVFAVMYLTPRGSQAVRAHTDDQDVFVLQLAGSKHWRIYSTPLPLPYEHEQLGKEPATQLSSEILGQPRLEVHLQPGELLYLPRGVPHEARADGGSSSLHLTLTVQTSDLTWAGLLMDGMQELHRRHARFRQGLPVPVLSNEQDEMQWRGLMQLSSELCAQAYTEAVQCLHARLARHNADQDKALALSEALARLENGPPRIGQERFAGCQPNLSQSRYGFPWHCFQRRTCLASSLTASDLAGICIAGYSEH